MNPYFIADQVRSIDLIRILPNLNCKPDPTDRKKWKTSKGTLSVTGQKFINWSSGSGGGGAIDLVMHLLDYSFSQAVLWLADTFSIQDSADSLRDSPFEKGPLRNRNANPCFYLPRPVQSNLNRVHDYLIRTRQLPESIISQLISKQSIYADFNCNAVFVMRDINGQVKGAELRGIGLHSFKGLAKGTCKRSSFFACGSSESKSLAICESAIDAISFTVIFPHMLAVSSAGTNESPDWVRHFINRHWRIFCAFDADPSGDAMTRALLGKYRNIGIIRPPRKDWNLCL